MEKVYSLRPLGFIESPFKQKFGTPRQNGLVEEACGTLRLDREVCPTGCLDGLDQFSHVWLTFGFHKNRPGNVSGKIHPPRLNGGKVGLFASRTPHRPNPLGLSLVQLIEVDVEELTLRVGGLDLIDQTPVFDIKPYIRHYDSVPVSSHGWLDHTEDIVFPVRWEQSATNLSSVEKQMIEKILCRDLRNLEDKKKDNNGPFKTLIGDFDIWFVYQDNHVMVQDIRFKR